MDKYCAHLRAKALSKTKEISTRDGTEYEVVHFFCFDCRRFFCR